MARKKNETIIYVTGAPADTLDRISRRYDIPLALLKEMNPTIKGPVYPVRIGQRVRIK